MTDYIKRIQSALGRKVKVTRSGIKEYMEAHHIDINQPTEEQIEAIKFHFLSELELHLPDSGDISIEIADASLTVLSEELETRGAVEVSLGDDSESLTSLPEITIPSENCINDGETAKADDALTINPEIRDMVSFKAVSMGIAIAENQIDIIASQIDATGSSFSETISEIENALIAYVDYQHSEESYQIDSMLTRVISRVASKNEAINQQLTNGISDFTQNLQDLEIAQKKIAGNILTRLKVPV